MNFLKGKLDKRFLILLSLMLLALVCFAIVVNAYAAWAPNTAYAVGAMVTYNGNDYKCLQAHTSLVGWEPPNVPALWQLIGPSGSASPSASPTATKTPTASLSPTKTTTKTPSFSATITKSPTSTKTPSSSASATKTSTVTATATKTPTATATVTPVSGIVLSINGNVLTWTDSANGNDYHVYKNGGWLAWTGNRTYTISGAVNGDKFYVTNGSGSVVSNTVTYGAPSVTPTNTTTPTLTPGNTPSATRTPTKTTTAHIMEIMTWVPAYNQSTWQSALNANTGGTYNPRNTLTRIGGQFWQVQSNGTNVQIASDADVQWTVNYCHSNGIKFLVCTFNYINNWNWQVASSAFANNKTTLINDLVNIVNRWGADGVDIDFEGNEGTDTYRAEFATFIRELGARLHGMGKELTVDTFPYIWNQPNTNWWPDWVGYVDGVNSMGYNELFGGGTSYQAYRWQQDTALAAGYKTYQFEMGMPGWLGDWGSGGMGTSVMAHVNELLSGNYNRTSTSICIWDAQFNGAGWLSAQVWDGLHQMRMKVNN